MAAIDNDWLEPLKPEFQKPYYKKLFEKVSEEYNIRKIFPASAGGVVFAGGYIRY